MFFSGISFGTPGQTREKSLGRVFSGELGSKRFVRVLALELPLSGVGVGDVVQEFHQRLVVELPCSVVEQLEPPGAEVPAPARARKVYKLNYESRIRKKNAYPSGKTLIRKSSGLKSERTRVRARHQPMRSPKTGC